MITGAQRTFDYRLGDEFGNFLEAAGKAAVSLNIYTVNIDGIDQRVEEVRFNYRDSVAKYRERLAATFRSATDSLKQMVDDIYPKAEKLGLLAHFIVEIESCRKQLLLTPDNTFRHKLFSFSNISKQPELAGIQKQEEEFSEYYVWMAHYLDKIQSYLALLKSSIEVTAQSEFKLPERLVPNPNASTEEKPFHFFEYLFNRHGIFYQKMSFKPSEDDYARYDNVKWNPKEESVTVTDYDPEDGNESQNVTFFKDVLRERMRQELLNSRQMIDNRISNITNEGEAKFYIKKCLAQLKFFLYTIPKHADSKKYDFLDLFARAAIKYIWERYSVFCDEFDETLKGAMDKATPIPAAVAAAAPLPRLPAAGTKVFAIQGLPTATFVTILHNRLKGLCFDENLELDTIANAFSGGTFERPLGIRWICRAKNKQVNKRTLIYMLDRLMDKKLVSDEMDNAAFLNLIKFIFVDGAGKPLAHVKVTASQIGDNKNTPDKYRNAIDQAIEDLLAEKSRQTGNLNLNG